MDDRPTTLYVMKNDRCIATLRWNGEWILVDRGDERWTDIVLAWLENWASGPVPRRLYAGRQTTVRPGDDGFLAAVAALITSRRAFGTRSWAYAAVPVDDLPIRLWQIEEVTGWNRRDTLAALSNVPLIGTKRGTRCRLGHLRPILRNRVYDLPLTSAQVYLLTGVRKPVPLLRRAGVPMRETRHGIHVRLGDVLSLRRTSPRNAVWMGGQNNE